MFQIFDLANDNRDVYRYCRIFPDFWKSGIVHPLGLDMKDPLFLEWKNGVRKKVKISFVFVILNSKILQSNIAGFY